jgi:hypothetical protein
MDTVKTSTNVLSMTGIDEIEEINQDLTALTADVATLDNQATVIQGEVTALQSSMAIAQSDIGILGFTLNNTNAIVSNIENVLLPLKRDLDDNDFTEINTPIIGVASGGMQISGNSFVNIDNDVTIQNPQNLYYKGVEISTLWAGSGSHTFTDIAVTNNLTYRGDELTTLLDEKFNNADRLIVLNTIQTDSSQTVTVNGTLNIPDEFIYQTRTLQSYLDDRRLLTNNSFTNLTVATDMGMENDSYAGYSENKLYFKKNTNGNTYIQHQTGSGSVAGMEFFVNDTIANQNRVAFMSANEFVVEKPAYFTQGTSILTPSLSTAGDVTFNGNRSLNTLHSLADTTDNRSLATETSLNDNYYTSTQVNNEITSSLAPLQSEIDANTIKVGISTTQANNITTNNAKVGITTAQANNITTNNAKVGISTTQANNITTNNAKVGISTTQANNITTNNAKVGITTAQANAITTNSNKTGITSQQASDITTNNAKVGISTTQANNITTNNAKVGISTTQANNITTNSNNITTLDGDTVKLATTSAQTKIGSLRINGQVAIGGAFDRDDQLYVYGTVGCSSTMSASTPTASTHLTTKAYVDTANSNTVTYINDEINAVTGVTSTNSADINTLELITTALGTQITTLDARNVKDNTNQVISGAKTFNSTITNFQNPTNIATTGYVGLVAFGSTIRADRNPRYSSNEMFDIGQLKWVYDGNGTTDTFSGSCAYTVSTRQGWFDTGTMTEQFRVGSNGTVAIANNLTVGSTLTVGTGIVSPLSTVADYRVTGGRPLGTTQINMRQARLDGNDIYKADWLSFNSIINEDSSNVIYRMACAEKITLRSACISFDKTSHVPAPTVSVGGELYRASFRLSLYKDTSPTFISGTFEYGVYTGVNAIPNAGGSIYLGDIIVRTGWNENLSCQSYIDDVVNSGLTWNRGDCISCFMTVSIEGDDNPFTGTFSYSNIPNEIRISLTAQQS